LRRDGMPAPAAMPARLSSPPWLAVGSDLAKRRRRDYRTAAGRRPVRDFIADLDDGDAAAVLAAMKDVEKNGLRVDEHLQDEIYEVKADGVRQTFRILFAAVGLHDQVLLSLEGFSKKTQKTPPGKIRRAKQRLLEWRTRGR
jgi:phage-related protein